MAKYTSADCKLCRREGCKLFLKGDRCVKGKCALDRRPTVPGQHAEANLRRKPTGYALQLREKQKVKRAYGLMERQFKRYYFEGKRQRGATGEVMLSMLERRLDNVVYRLGFGVSRGQCRQIVNHGHITVNGKKVNIPSYQVKVGDVITSLIPRAFAKPLANTVFPDPKSPFRQITMFGNFSLSKFSASSIVSCSSNEVILYSTLIT